jgi:predicted glutamine amidotransferase
MLAALWAMLAQLKQQNTLRIKVVADGFSAGLKGAIAAHVNTKSSALSIIRYLTKGNIMCLIIHKPASVYFNNAWLKDFYRKNRDGAGIMWNVKGVVEVEKITSPTESEWIDFYNTYAAKRDCVIHLRMRTHGTISDENTHPYYISNGIWLMHNGILSTGNAKDIERSDTWHFIQDVLKPALRRDEKFLNKQDHVERLGKQIGSNNKFVFCGVRKSPLIVNKSAGVIRKGAWFSNTYAWTKHQSFSIEKRWYLDPKENAKKQKQLFPGNTGQMKIWTYEEWLARESNKYYMQ